ncbi:MAG TPA: hypothetical protein VFI25_17290 [Planctomycetota bacterium]|jgi:hypothetical protein|nr:hypothetical protein [Planctomycetota bacterium]
MSCRLSKKETITTIGALEKHGVPKSQVARDRGVVEGAVRDHLKRMASGAKDGRRDKPS